MAFGHVDITGHRIRDDVGRVGQCVGRITPDAWGAQCHQDLPVGTELDDDATLVTFAREHLEFVGARRACVGHPHVTVAIDVDAMWPHEHPRAEAPDLST